MGAEGGRRIVTQWGQTPSFSHWLVMPLYPPPTPASSPPLSFPLLPHSTLTPPGDLITKCPLVPSGPIHITLQCGSDTAWPGQSPPGPAQPVHRRGQHSAKAMALWQHQGTKEQEWLILFPLFLACVTVWPCTACGLRPHPFHSIADRLESPKLRALIQVSPPSPHQPWPPLSCRSTGPGLSQTV